MQDKSNILYIDSWNSICGSCGKNCDYKEIRHDSWMGYEAMHIADTQHIDYPLEGCHAVFEYIEYIGPGPIAGYTEYAKNICNDLRSDLKQL